MSNLTSKNFEVGIDLVELSSIVTIYSKHGEKFARKILTFNELEFFKNHKDKINFLAGRFCAKEAISKALGIGLKKFGLIFRHLEILPNDLGQPILTILEPLGAHIKVSNICDKVWSISISHHGAYATAIAMWQNSAIESFKTLDPTQ